MLGTSLREDRDAILRCLSMTGRLARLQAVGALGAPATGPFGHQDRVGQVWEWTMSPIGYLGGREAFDKEWRALRKDKETREFKVSPNIPDGDMVTKGSCYLNGGEPITLHLDVRIPKAPDQMMSLLGFRVAKSLSPGADLARSRIKANYRMNLFAGAK